MEGETKYTRSMTKQDFPGEVLSKQNSQAGRWPSSPSYLHSVYAFFKNYIIFTTESPTFTEFCTWPSLFTKMVENIEKNNKYQSKRNDSVAPLNSKTPSSSSDWPIFWSPPRLTQPDLVFYFATLHCRPPKCQSKIQVLLLKTWKLYDWNNLLFINDDTSRKSNN